MNILGPVELYSDGSSLRNPGPSGFAYIIKYMVCADDTSMPKESYIEFNQGYRLSTNNRMEVMAAIAGIKDIIKRVDEGSFQNVRQIIVLSDSEYFVKALAGNWIIKWQQNDWMTSGYKGSKITPVKNRDLWEQVIAIQADLRRLGINLQTKHVRGHSGNKMNERADTLAVLASNNNSTHLIDEEYEKVYSTLYKSKNQNYNNGNYHNKNNKYGSKNRNWGR